MRTIPHRCYPCSDLIVETEDGNVRGFVGALRFPQDTQAPICPECNTPMVPAIIPVRAVNTNSQVGHDLDPQRVAE